MGEHFRSHAWQRARVGELDAELVRLGRGAAALRLGLGEVLEALAARQGHHALGFSSLGAYAVERCGRSERWVADSRALARKLAGLPRLRHALLAGRVSWCMAEVVARYAAAESEAFLVALAPRLTVRRMKALLAGASGAAGTDGAAGAGTGGEGASGVKAGEGAREGTGGEAAGSEAAGDERRVHVRRTVDREVAAFFEEMRLLVQSVVGSRASDAMWEALLAEGMTSLADFMEEVPEPRVRRPPPEQGEHEPPAAGAVPGVPEVRWEVADDVRGLDAEAVRLAGELALRDLVIGELSLEMRELNGADALGYASDRQYWVERLGLSATSIKDRQTLVRRVARFPDLQRALEEGAVGLAAGRLLARIVTQETEAAWVAHARGRTFKHLREEVERVEVAARVHGAVPGFPPEDDGGRMFEGDSLLAPMADDPTNVAPRKMGRVRVGWWMSEALALQFVAVERAWVRAGRPYGDVLRFLGVTFWKAWEHTFEPDVAYAEVYARDGWVCASPTCTRRDVTPHHLVFRSQGGGDEMENVVSLCSWCHLQGIHTWGAIKATGAATRMRWRTPVLEVCGRRVVWRAATPAGAG
jgi:hypothetical protein